MKRTISRFLDPRPLAAYCSRLTAYGLLLTAHCLLLTFSCGGDDKSSGGSSGGSAKARVEATLEEWTKKDCEVSFACGGKFGSSYGSVEACQAQEFEFNAQYTRREGGALAKPDSCYGGFVDNYEACKNVLVSQPALTLCTYFSGTTFLTTPVAKENIFAAYPECGAALDNLRNIPSGCNLEPQVFLGAPTRVGSGSQ